MNNSLRTLYLKTIGIQSWQLKSAPDIEPVELIQTSTSPFFKGGLKGVKQLVSNPLSPPSKEGGSEDPVVTELDSKLCQTIKHCQLCASRTKRLNALPGQGNSQASVFFISEPPNAEEDRSGHYLTGQAQTLFHAMLESIGLNEQYFLTGLIKCHSSEQFLLTDEEVKNCATHLQAQLQEIKPTVLIVFGAVQAQMVLQTEQSFNELRGKTHSVKINEKNYSVVVSYHPAFLLRNPLYKREALKDLIMVKKLLK